MVNLEGAMRIGIGIALALTAAAASGATCETQSYGAGVAIVEATPIAAIAARPDDFVGKTVRVEGEVKAVCAAAGCWMDLAADGGATGGEGGGAAGGGTLRVKVDDGKIVFPVAAKGKRAAAEGVVEAIEMSREGYVAALRHEADETGVPFDEASVGPGPYRLVRIHGTGAEVCY
jgi:hypothetical protein